MEKIKLNTKWFPGLTNVYFDGEHFRAFDSVAGYDVSVGHLMTKRQMLRVRRGGK